MEPGRINRRQFVAAGAGSGVVLASAIEGACHASEPPSGLVDCQSHLFLPAVVDLMRRRTQDPRVYDDNGTTFLKMGAWLRKIPPEYLDVNAKLKAMDASGIAVTMLRATYLYSFLQMV
jgi:hypothetical protein